MKKFLFCFFAINASICFSQVIDGPGLFPKTHTLVIKYSETGNVSELTVERGGLIRKHKYTFKIEGINTALHSVKATPTFTRKFTAIPDILKPILPMTTSSEVPAFEKLSKHGVPGTHEDVIEDRIIEVLHTFEKIRYVDYSNCRSYKDNKRQRIRTQ